MDYPTTRTALHGVAELLLAGPQYDAIGTIKLRVTPGGFRTIGEPHLRVDGDQLVTANAAFFDEGRAQAQT